MTPEPSRPHWTEHCITAILCAVCILAWRGVYQVWCERQNEANNKNWHHVAEAQIQANKELHLELLEAAQTDHAWARYRAMLLKDAPSIRAARAQEEGR